VRNKSEELSGGMEGKMWRMMKWRKCESRGWRRKGGGPTQGNEKPRKKQIMKDLKY
jgi:hypothetical protein